MSPNLPPRAVHICPVRGDVMVDALEVIPQELLRQKVLDHGFVNVIDVMPRLVPANAPTCDFALAEAARQSYQKGTVKVNDDAALIDYLTRNMHTSPIEMGVLKYHLRLPIVVMRQLVRHRTSSLNEESARYSELAADFYVPEPQNWAINTAANKQAGVIVMPGQLGAFTEKQAEFLCERLRRHNDLSYELYQLLLGARKVGDDANILSSAEDEARIWQALEIPAVAREQARMVLGVNIYTQCYWRQDLKNMLHLLKLRTDRHAQFEIRCYGDPMAKVTEALFPAAWKSWKDNFIDGINLSRTESILMFRWLEVSFGAHSGNGADLTLAFGTLCKTAGWTGRRAVECANKLTKILTPRIGLVDTEKLPDVMKTIIIHKADV